MSGFANTVLANNGYPTWQSQYASPQSGALAAINQAKAAERPRFADFVSRDLARLKAAIAILEPGPGLDALLSQIDDLESAILRYAALEAGT